MDLDLILRLVLLGILHWILAIMMLEDLASRKRVLGGRKALWAILIVCITLLGSVLYLLCHPQILTGKDDNSRP